MDLPARAGRGEDADGPHVGVSLQRVVLVPVQQVHHPGFDAVLLAGLLVDQLSLAADAVHRLDVVRVPHLRFGARVQDGLVQREPDALLGQDEAAAAPGRGLHVALGADDVGKRTNDHESPLSLRPGGLPGQTATVARTASSDSAMISRPRSSSVSVVVSGGSSLTTSPSGPEVSMSSPRLNASAHTFGASSASV